MYINFKVYFLNISLKILLVKFLQIINVKNSLLSLTSGIGIFFFNFLAAIWKNPFFPNHW